MVDNTAAEAPATQEIAVAFEQGSTHTAERPPEACFECDPGTMAQVYFGAVRPSDAVRMGAATADSPETIETLDALMGQRMPFLHPLDVF
jgi:hypothetical protein